MPKVKEEPEEKIPSPEPVIQHSPTPPPREEQQQRREPTPVAIVQQQLTQATPREASPDAPPPRVETPKDVEKPSSAESHKSIVEGTVLIFECEPKIGPPH